MTNMYQYFNGFVIREGTDCVPADCVEALFEDAGWVRNTPSWQKEKFTLIFKNSTLGVMSILLGTFLYFYMEEGHFNSRVILGIVFVFMTSPVAGHLISRAAYNSGVKLSNSSVQDDLKKVRSNKKSNDARHRE